MIILTIRYIILFFTFLTASLIALILCIVRPFNRNNTYVLGRVYGYALFPFMGAKIEYRGRDILRNETRPCILVANHQENYDTFVIGCMSTPKTVSIGKRSILYFPVFGLIYWLAGNVLINRKSRSDALRTMDEAGQYVVDNNLKVLIMPEGTRSRGKGLRPFKKGAFHLAVKFGLPIIPIAVSSYSDMMDLKKLHWGTIKLQALAPIEPDGTDRDAIERLRDKCYEAIKTGIEQLDSEND